MPGLNNGDNDPCSSLAQTGYRGIIGRTRQERVVALTYQTGDEIRRGDRVTYGGNAGSIGLVVEGPTGDPEADWLFENHGAGIMVVEPTTFGRVYLHAPHDEEDLLFVARAQ